MSPVLGGLIAYQVLHDAASAIPAITWREFCERRMPRVVAVRHTALWLAREMTGCSYPELGRIVGQDHSTVIAAVRKVQRKIERHDVEARLLASGLVKHAQEKSRERRSSA